MPNKICPICHSAIPEDSKFCFVCGSNLEDGTGYPNQQAQNQQQYYSPPQNVAQMPPQQPPYMPNNLSGNNNGKGPNKGMIALIAFAIAALVAIIILLTLLLSRGSDKAEPAAAPADTTATATKTDTVYQTVVQQPAPEPVYRPSFQEGGTFKFSGSIPGAGGIRMTLTNSGGNVSGTYYYTKIGTPIYLSGTLSGNRLYLSSQYDSWDGTISGRRYSGSFYNFETGRTFRFNTKY